MRKTTKVIVGSALTMAMCATLITGATLALFTSEDKVDIAVTSGKVDVEASVTNLWTYSNAEEDVELDAIEGWQDATKEGTTLKGDFATKGTATYSVDGGTGTLTLTNIAPGDAVKFTLSITNNSNISIKYQVRITVGEEGSTDSGDEYPDSKLSAALELWLNEKLSEGFQKASTEWFAMEPSEPTATQEVRLRLPKDAGDEYQSKKCQISLTVVATQGNAAAATYCAANGGHYYDAVNDQCIYCGEVNPIKGHYELEGDGGSQKCVVTVDETMGGDLVIPSTVNGVPVVVKEEISEETVKNSSLLRKEKERLLAKNQKVSFDTLVIEEGVSVGGWVFWNASIEHLVLEGNATYDNYAFCSVKGLKDVTIRGDVELGLCVFSSDTSLESVDMSEATMESIPQNTFTSCSSLQKLQLPNNLKVVGFQAFSECDLRVVVLPSTVEEIWGRAFERNGNLQKVIFQNKIENERFGLATSGPISPSTVFDLSGSSSAKVELCFTGSEEEWDLRTAGANNARPEKPYTGLGEQYNLTFTHSYVVTEEDLAANK